jgi:hypothetical protein
LAADSDPAGRRAAAPRRPRNPCFGFRWPPRFRRGLETLEGCPRLQEGPEGEHPRERVRGRGRGARRWRHVLRGRQPGLRIWRSPRPGPARCSSRFMPRRSTGRTAASGRPNPSSPGSSTGWSGRLSDPDDFGKAVSGADGGFHARQARGRAQRAGIGGIPDLATGPTLQLAGDAERTQQLAREHRGSGRRRANQLPARPAAPCPRPRRPGGPGVEAEDPHATAGDRQHAEQDLFNTPVERQYRRCVRARLRDRMTTPAIAQTLSARYRSAMMISPVSIRSNDRVNRSSGMCRPIGRRCAVSRR